MNSLKRAGAGFVFGAALFVGLMTGCAGPVQHSPRAGVDSPPPRDVFVEAGAPMEDEYVYYPAYQVYYSSYRQQYVYLEQGSWVTRYAPPRVARKGLASSPSVKLDFKDSPSLHHAEVVEQYPKDWKPSGGENEGREEQRGRDRDRRD